MTSGELTIEIIHLNCEIRRTCENNAIPHTEKMEQIRQFRSQIEDLRLIRDMLEL